MPSVSECNNPDPWNLLLEDNPSASAYLLWEYGEALCQTYQYRRHYLVCESGDDLVGALPLIHIKSLLFGNRLISLPFCEYGGPFFRSGLKEKEVLESWKLLQEATIDLAVRLGVDYIELRQPMLSQSIFLDNGFNDLQSYVTFRIELTKGAKQLWNSLDRKTRSTVRKSQRSALEVEEIKGPSQLKEYYMLYLQTQERLGSPPHCFNLFQNLSTAFSTGENMRMTLARHKGVPIAGITVFLQCNTLFWWNNVSDIGHRNLNSTNLLLWNTIEWAAENGFKTMDLGRTRKFSTIYDFKGGWGGEETPLRNYVCFLGSEKKSLPDPSQRKYRFLSTIWNLLPTTVARKIGPHIIKGIAL